MAQGKEQDELQRFLRTLVPVDGMDEFQQDEILDQAETVEFRRGTYIFKQGDRDNWSYYVLAGEIELLSGDQLVKTVAGCSEAARYALSQLQPRQMSARAKNDVRILRINRGKLDAILKAQHEGTKSDIGVSEIEEEDTGDWMTHMLRSDLFSQIPAANIQQIFMHMQEVSMQAGDVVIQQGTPGDYYYILNQGRAAVTRRASGKGPEVKLAELSDGDSFGEEALVSDATRNATITMLTDGHLMRLTKADFIELIQKPVLNAVNYARAQELIAGGALWFDPRSETEHAKCGIEGRCKRRSSNIGIGYASYYAPWGVGRW